MKRFIWFLILVAAAYFLWKYYPEVERRARERTAPKPPAESPEPAPDAAGPRPATRSPTPAPAADPIDAELARKFPLPEFQPIEAVVGNWIAIPPSAFPRQIVTREALSLPVAGGLGTARIEAGSRIVALSARAGVLVVAPAIDSPIRGEVPIDQTNFKEVLGAVYEEFKERKRAEVLAARRQAGGSAPASTPTSSPLPDQLEPPIPDPPPAVLAKIGPRPAQQTDRTVPLMVSSIQERQAAAARQKRESEPKLSDIKSWGRIRYQDVDGEPFWVGSVRYTAHTIFGEFPAEALALIRNGKVDKWIYAGTGEPVF